MYNYLAIYHVQDDIILTARSTWVPICTYKYTVIHICIRTCMLLRHPICRDPDLNGYLIM